MKLINHLF